MTVPKLFWNVLPKREVVKPHTWTTSKWLKIRKINFQCIRMNSKDLNFEN
jgi:hypothetical protein